jgi:hypothetical protein
MPGWRGEWDNPQESVEGIVRAGWEKEGYLGRGLALVQQDQAQEIG